MRAVRCLSTPQCPYRPAVNSRTTLRRLNSKCSALHHASTKLHESPAPKTRHRQLANMCDVPLQPCARMSTQRNLERSDRGKLVQPKLRRCFWHMCVNVRVFRSEDLVRILSFCIIFLMTNLNKSSHANHSKLATSCWKSVVVWKYFFLVDEIALGAILLLLANRYAWWWPRCLLHLLFFFCFKQYVLFQCSRPASVFFLARSQHGTIYTFLGDTF